MPIAPTPARPIAMVDLYTLATDPTFTIPIHPSFGVQYGTHGVSS
jgi:hypothetical protein